MTTEIGINEIAACVNIIDIVCQRGGFKGPELTTVGSLRDKLAKFVEENKEEEPEYTEDEPVGTK